MQRFPQTFFGAEIVAIVGEMYRQHNKFTNPPKIKQQAHLSAFQGLGIGQS
jgi:hypothetical protein